jgi:hypothetical protein
VRNLFGPIEIANYLLTGSPNQSAKVAESLQFSIQVNRSFQNIFHKNIKNNFFLKLPATFILTIAGNIEYKYVAIDTKISLYCRKGDWL